MKNQLNHSSVRMTEKFDQQLYSILTNELKTVRNTKPQLIKRLNLTNDGLMVA